MKIAEKTRDRLVVKAGDQTFAWLLLALAGGCLGIAGVIYFVNLRAISSEGFQMALLAACLFLVGFLALFEQATFIFDRKTRQLTWRRRRVFSNRSGIVPLDQIQAVISQTNLERNPKRRLALVLPGEELPLSVAYAPDPGGVSLELAETIRQFLDKPERA